MKISSIKCRYCGDELVPKLTYVYDHEVGKLMDTHDNIKHSDGYNVTFSQENNDV